MKRLVEAFRRGRNDILVKQPFQSFDLHETATVRPVMSTYGKPPSDAFFTRMIREVHESVHASKRIGKEWVPLDGSTIKKRSDDDVWATREDLKPLDDVCTKFCTFKYFPDAASRIAMVTHVTRCFSLIGETLSRHVRGAPDVEVIFKGGVMQRLVILELIHDLPAAVHHQIIQYLTQYKALSISDLDFELHTHSKSVASHHRLALMSFLTLVHLQHDMNLELSGEIPPRLLNQEWDKEKGKEELKERLQKEIATLPSSHPLHGARVDDVGMFPLKAPKHLPHRTRSGKTHPDPRSNIFIFECGEEICVADAQQTLTELGISMQHMKHSQSIPLYTNLNMYIGEDTQKTRKDHLRSVFHLARIKHTFNLYYTTKSGEKRVDRLAGEMIDMSQGAPTDENRKLFASRVPKPYRHYHILGGPGTVLSYTMLGFLMDTLHTIHHTDTEPQKANKLVKRQCRYVAFLVGVLLETFTVKACVDELQRLKDGLSKSTSRPKFAHPVTKLVYDYERPLAGTTYAAGLCRSITAWVRAMTLSQPSFRTINDVHMYHMHKFVTQRKK